MGTSRADRIVEPMSAEPPAELAREREVFALLAEVCELDPESRERALADCEDAELVDEVRRRLAVRESAIGWLEAPDPKEPDLRPVQVGDRIGPFEIRGVLGEGGMGQVFRARQHEPVKRDVALKIVRLGRLQVDAKVRFDAERQAMARLDHPNIGRILEAGTTEDGQPYFAMELIDGPPITVFCDRASLTIEERLRLFLEVCRGTHHAHLKLLLHRDLKPSNVLVAEVDGRPVPKIIDFGIAKGLGTPLVTAAAHTGDGFLGTPAYMSPEALEPGEEVDTRSDVFSLGVLLYELLTGALPWGTAAESHPLQWVKRRLERDAKRPSTQVTGLAEESRSQVAKARQLDGDALAKRLRGDLDSLVMKAIEPEPARRYESAAELADDIERYLAGESILARPLTTGVLLRKLIRRHRLPVLAATAVLLTLVIGSIGTALGLLRAQRAEQQAVAAKDLAIAEAQAAEEARDEAEEARDEANEVAEFLIRVFSGANTQALAADKPPGEISALDLLASGAERIQTELMDRPLARARLESAMGLIYRSLAEYDRSLELHRSSIAILEAESPPPAFQLAQSYLRLADTELELSDRAAAQRNQDKALALLETLTGKRAMRLRGQALGVAGRQRIAAGDLAGAEHAFRSSAEIYDQLGAEFAGFAANMRYNLGAVYSRLGRFAEAETIFRQGLEVYKTLVEAGHPQLAEYGIAIGGAVASQGRLEEAAVLFEEAERTIRLRRGEHHPSRATVLANLGELNKDLGRLDRAQSFLRQALEIRERALGDKHPQFAFSLGQLASVLSKLGRDGEARPMQERSLAILESTLGTEHPSLAPVLASLMRMAMRRGDYELARDYAERGYRLVAATLGTRVELLGQAAADLGEALWHLGRQDEARQYFDEAKQIFEDGGESTAESLEEIEALLARLGMADDRGL